VTEVVCLRCDWKGASGKSCPRCGAPLYRVVAPPPPRTPRTPTAGPGAIDEDGSSVSPESPERVPRTPHGVPSSPWGALSGLAAIVVVIALVWARIPHGEGPGPTADFGRRPFVSAGQGRGFLVYVATEGPGHGRDVIWKLDLARGIATEGPEIPRAIELVDARAAGAGWAGLTAVRGSGEQAFLLHGTSPSVGPVALARGARIAWGPGGASLASVSAGTDRHGCVGVRVLNVLTGIGDHLLDVCSPVEGLGRSSTATYFSTELGNVYFTGVVGVEHRIATGFRILSVSPASDFLLTSTRTGAASYWQGSGEPIPLGTRDADLRIDRVLTWSSDGSRAAVEGRLGGRKGVWLIDAGPGPGPREPTFVVPGGSEVAATFSDPGALFVAIDGHAMVLTDRGLADVLLPSNAPPPSGPIVWIP
jgi:hypothetical protein